MAGVTKFFCFMELELGFVIQTHFHELSSVFTGFLHVLFFSQFLFTGWELSWVVSGPEVKTPLLNLISGLLKTFF